jgi:hypothetical protein
MENPQPPQISVSGHIVIEGQLPAPSSASSEKTPAPPPAPPWWKFWQRSSPWWGEHQRLTAHATLLLAVSTVALATFSLIQISDFRDQERRQLRAYIGVAIGQIEKFTATTLVEGSIIVKNFGQTPAYNIIDTGAAIVPAQFPFIGSLRELLKSNMIPAHAFALLNPTQDLLINIVSKRLYTDDEISKINDGREWRLYLLGKITYRDAFGEDHYTNFCFDYSAETIRTKQGVDICDFYGAD